MPDMNPTTTTKDDLLAGIAAERRFWDALVAAVEEAGLMDRPGANGESWTFRDMAAHLNAWRALTVARLEAASRGGGPPDHPWPEGMSEETRDGVDGVDEINAWFAARDAARSTADVLAEATSQFDALAAVVSATAPDDLLTPGRFAWLDDAAIGPAVLGGSFGHMHVDHESDIRAWLRRETGDEPDLPPAPPTFGYGGVVWARRKTGKRQDR